MAIAVVNAFVANGVRETTSTPWGVGLEGIDSSIPTGDVALQSIDGSLGFLFTLIGDENGQHFVLTWL